MSTFAIVSCALFYGSVVNSADSGDVNDLNNILHKLKELKLELEPKVNRFTEERYNPKFSAKEQKAKDIRPFLTISDADYDKCMGHLQTVRTETHESSRNYLKVAENNLAKLFSSVLITLEDIEAVMSSSNQPNLIAKPVEIVNSDIDNHMSKTEESGYKVYSDMVKNLVSLEDELNGKLVQGPCAFIAPRSFDFINDENDPAPIIMI